MESARIDQRTAYQLENDVEEVKSMDQERESKSMLERISQATDDNVVWQPDVGDYLAGSIIDLRHVPSKFDERMRIVLEVESEQDGRIYTVFCWTDLEKKVKRLAAAVAEDGIRGKLAAAGGAGPGQRRAAAQTEARVGAVSSLASGALHRVRLAELRLEDRAPAFSTDSWYVRSRSLGPSRDAN